MMTFEEQKEELLSRTCDAQSGTRVTNCVMHMNISLLKRPANCTLCTADIVNQLMVAINVNQWLNEWKDDAEKILKSHD
jgi:hypothetical protein